MVYVLIEKQTGNALYADVNKAYVENELNNQKLADASYENEDYDKYWSENDEDEFYEIVEADHSKKFFENLKDWNEIDENCSRAEEVREMTLQEYINDCGGSFKIFESNGFDKIEIGDCEFGTIWKVYESGGEEFYVYE